MAKSVYDPSIVTEQEIKLGEHGDYKLVELTRSRKRKFRNAMNELERLENDESDEAELASVLNIGLAIEASTEGSDGIADKLRADYESDRITDGFLARALKQVISWEHDQQQLGKA